MSVRNIWVTILHQSIRTQNTFHSDILPTIQFTSNYWLVDGVGYGLAKYLAYDSGVFAVILNELNSSLKWVHKVARSIPNITV